MDSEVPGTSYRVHNEKDGGGSVRLSLLAKEGDIPYADGGRSEHEEGDYSSSNKTSNSSANNSQDSGVITSSHGILSAPNWYPPIDLPPNNPPMESRCLGFFTSLMNFFVGTVLFLLFLIGLPVFLALFILLGILIRVGVKIALSSSPTTLLSPYRVFSSGSGNHSSVLVVCSGHCEIQKIRRTFMNVINSGRFYKLRRRLTTRFGYLCLSPSRIRFDIKNHVKYFDNRKNGIPAQTVTESDVVSFLESSYKDAFRDEEWKQLPQWEALIVPEYTQAEAPQREQYAIIFRFQNGIMDWETVRELVVLNLGRSNSRMCPAFKSNLPKRGLRTRIWTQVKIYFAVVFLAPVEFVKKLLTSDDQTMFSVLKRRATDEISMAMTNPMNCDTWVDIQQRTSTGNGVHSLLGTFVRIAARNLLLGYNLSFPKKLRVTRVFGAGEVDTFTVNYQMFRSVLQRLHASHCAIEIGRIGLAAQRIFNKWILTMGSMCPLIVANWLYRLVLKGDVVLEIWPGLEEHCEIFGGDVVTSMTGWSGFNGTSADFKVTVSCYRGRIQGNVLSRLGQLPEDRSGAEILSEEMEEEYKLIAANIGIYPNQMYMN